MSDTEKPKAGVTLSNFAEPILAELSAGDILRMYHNQESKRKRDDGDYDQRDIGFSFRTAPEGLMIALDRISSITGWRKSVITKCLSHHVLSWYQSLPQMSASFRLHNILADMVDGHPDIWRKVQRDDYEFIHTQGVTSDSARVSTLRTIGFVLGALTDIGEVIGVPVYKLLLTGMCWSVSTNTEDWVPQVVTKYLKPEGERMKEYISEKLFATRGNIDVVRFRDGKIGVEDCFDGLDEKC